MQMKEDMNDLLLLVQKQASNKVSVNNAYFALDLHSTSVTCAS